MRKSSIAVLILSLVMVLTSFVPSMAVSNKDSAYKYKYRIMIYSGMQGHFTSDNTSAEGTVWTKEFTPGERVEVYLKDTLGFVLDNDKYYVRGLRVTGHDNDENTGLQSLNFSANRDVSYEIAYGIRGALVAYKVEYVDEDGKKLHPNDTYYGMPGDRPVVSYRYIAGYKPNVYTIKKTLSKDESQNVFTFVYRKLSPEEEEEDGGSKDNGTTVYRTVVVGGNGHTVEYVKVDDDDEEDEETDEEADERDDVTRPDQGGHDTQGGSFLDSLLNLFDMEDGPIPRAARFIKEHPILGLIYIAAFLAVLLLIILLIKRRKKDKDKDKEKGKNNNKKAGVS